MVLDPDLEVIVNNHTIGMGKPQFEAVLIL